GTEKETTAPPPTDGYAGTARTTEAAFARPTAPPIENPIVGTPAPAPRLTADASTSRPSPKYLSNEADFFHETRSMIDNAKSGDVIGVQMYEFQNAATNPNDKGAPNAPGYADQQALLPSLAAAAKRGVKVNLILDASMDPKTHTRTNQVIA